jgi:outer membrane protein OmpA-like peptidoglycan-associated protein
VDNQSDIITTDPDALYTSYGEFLMDGTTQGGGFTFYIPAHMTGKLVAHDTSRHSEIQLDVIKSLHFMNGGSTLAPHDEHELEVIVHNLQKSSHLKVEIDVHADTRTEPAEAMALSTKQANALQAFLRKKGVPENRITIIAKGNTEPRKKCSGTNDCSEADHLMNRRVEIILYKD